MPQARADAVLNIFAKPYQTALALLSLLRHSASHIDRIYLQFEPAGSRYDPEPPYAVAEYLREQGQKLEIFQPEIWIKRRAAERERLGDPAYRLALRYQYAFEHARQPYLFVMHNDMMLKRDLVGAMLRETDGAFAVGAVGQCWNCPASSRALARDSGLGDEPCSPGRYQAYRPDFAALERLYALARERGVSVRPYWEGWRERYAEEAWPLPECRVNEWGCLVDLRQTRGLTAPEGDILPFGAYEPCGSVNLDIAVAWFRDLHRRGLRARHFDLGKYIKHWVGNFRMSRAPYEQAEQEARDILLRGFPDFAGWCRRKGKKLFA